MSPLLSAHLSVHCPQLSSQTDPCLLAQPTCSALHVWICLSSSSTSSWAQFLCHLLQEAFPSIYVESSLHTSLLLPIAPPPSPRALRLKNTSAHSIHLHRFQMLQGRAHSPSGPGLALSTGILHCVPFALVCSRRAHMRESGRLHETRPDPQSRLPPHLDVIEQPLCKSARVWGAENIVVNKAVSEFPLWLGG